MTWAVQTWCNDAWLFTDIAHGLMGGDVLLGAIEYEERRHALAFPDACDLAKQCERSGRLTRLINLTDQSNIIMAAIL